MPALGADREKGNALNFFALNLRLGMSRNRLIGQSDPSLPNCCGSHPEWHVTAGRFWLSWGFVCNSANLMKVRS